MLTEVIFPRKKNTEVQKLLSQLRAYLSQGVLRLFLEHRTGLAHVRLLIHYLINEYKAQQNPRTTTETKSDALKDN